MKKIIIILSLLLIISCTTNNQDSNINWRTGTEGLTMNFAQNSPPVEVLSNQDVSVIVEYSNKGASDISDLKFYLSGYDSSILNFAQKGDSSLPLQGKDQYNPSGGQADIVKWTASVNSPSDVDSFEQEITLTACYRYKTIANPQICIDPKKYDYTSSSTCSFDIKNLGSSQGGPIAVTSIKQKSTTDKVLLEIYIENKGGGVPFTTSIDNCHTSLDLRDVNTINVGAVTLSGTQMFSCEPPNPVRLDNGKGYIVCRTGISGSSYYVSPLTITLDYGYRQSISKTITVVNVG